MIQASGKTSSVFISFCLELATKYAYFVTRFEYKITSSSFFM